MHIPNYLLPISPSHNFRDTDHGAEGCGNHSAVRNTKRGRDFVRDGTSNRD